MKHWTYYRYDEMKEKAGYNEMISMGPGYNEWETESDEEILRCEDWYLHSISYRLEKHSRNHEWYPKEYDHKMELAIRHVCDILNTAHNEWIKLNEFTASIAFAEIFKIDPMELYAEVYERYNER